MNHLKTYNLFLESKKDMNIYEFSDILKSLAIGRRRIDDLSEIKTLSERFIGPGIFHRVEKLVDDILSELKKVDIEILNQILSEVFDEFLEKQNRLYLCMLYCDPESLSKPLKDRFNGAMTVLNIEERRNDFIISILRDIVNPTLFSGWHNNKPIRKTDEQIYVLDAKWNCVNFDYKNYDIDLSTGSPGDQKIKNYDVENFFQCYRPGVYISIYELTRSSKASEYSLKEFEDAFDRVMPQILSELNSEEILWDYSRGDRKFDTSIKIAEYTVTILLKMS